MINNKALISIGVAAQMTNTTIQTLRHYEQESLIAPNRKGKWRYFSLQDISWLDCLQKMITEHGLSVAVIKKLLRLTPCWNICDCPFEKRKQCTAFMASGLVPRKINPSCRVARYRTDIAEAA